MVKLRLNRRGSLPWLPLSAMRIADPFSTSSSANGCHHPSNHLDLHVNWTLFFSLSLSLPPALHFHMRISQTMRAAHFNLAFCLRCAAYYYSNTHWKFVCVICETRSVHLIHMDRSDECATGEWGTFGVISETRQIECSHNDESVDKLVEN